MSGKGSHPSIGDIIYVLWLDAASREGWQPLADHIENGCEPIVSCGILVRYDKKTTIIAQSVDMDGNAADVLSIPRGMVKYVEVLRKSKC